MLEIIGQLLSVFFSLYAYRFFNDWMDKRKNKKTLYQPTISELVHPILSSIMDESAALRVDYWEAENGEKTLSGHSILKLTMFHEILGYNSKAIKSESIISECVKIPVESFQRNMLAMKADKNNRFYISYECDRADELAYWYKNTHTDTLVILKTYTKGEWTGMITISFEGRKAIESAAIAWLKTQASRADDLVKKSSQTTN